MSGAGHDRLATRSVIERYLQCWLESDRAGARSLLSDEMRFRSPRESYYGADAFLDACWCHADRFDAIEILHGIYDEHAGYVVYRMEDLVCGELIHVSGGKIDTIHVTFDPTA